MTSMNKQGKMAGYINWRMKVTLNDSRQMSGLLLAYDRHLNLVLADTEEFRRIKRKQAKSGAPGAGSSANVTVETEEKRTLGLTIVRGSMIVSLVAESPPPADPAARLGKTATSASIASLAAGPGVARPAGRGIAAPPSLAGPVAGVGGAPPPGFGGFPPAPGFPAGRGGPPPGFPGAFPPAGFPGAPFPPPGFNPGGPPPPGFNPPSRR